MAKYTELSDSICEVHVKMANLSDKKPALEPSEHLADVADLALNITDFVFGTSDFGEYVKFVAFDGAGERHEVLTSAMLVVKTFRNVERADLPMTARFHKSAKYWDILPVVDDGGQEEIPF